MKTLVVYRLFKCVKIFHISSFFFCLLNYFIYFSSISITIPPLSNKDKQLPFDSTDTYPCNHKIAKQYAILFNFYAKWNSVSKNKSTENLCERYNSWRIIRNTSGSHLCDTISYIIKPIIRISKRLMFCISCQHSSAFANGRYFGSCSGLMRYS